MWTVPLLVGWIVLYTFAGLWFARRRKTRRAAKEIAEKLHEDRIGNLDGPSEYGPAMN
jgi:hypothetical protein